jgi:outer membrane protein TolC
MAQIRRDRLTAYVQLYKALGGGWQAFEPKPAAATASNPTPKS